MLGIFWAIVTLFVGLSVWWTFYYPYNPKSLYQPIPSYAFYASDDHPEFDPVTIAAETGLSRDHLFSIVLAKTMLNAYRIYSGEDRVIPYFTVDKHSAMLNLDIPFEIPACIFGNCGPPEEEI